MATYGRTSYRYTGSAALTGGELLKWTAANECQLATAVTDKIVGTAAEACGAGDVTKQNINVIPLVTGTTVQVIAAGALSAGTYVAVTAGGQVTTAAAKSATGNTTLSKQLGWLNEAAGAANEVVEMVCEVQEVNV